MGAYVRSVCQAAWKRFVQRMLARWREVCARPGTESGHVSKEGGHGGVLGREEAPVQQCMGQALAGQEFQGCQGWWVEAARSSRYVPPEADSFAAHEEKAWMMDFLVGTECQSPGELYDHFALSKWW